MCALSLSCAFCLCCLHLGFCRLHIGCVVCHWALPSAPWLFRSQLGFYCLHLGFCRLHLSFNVCILSFSSVCTIALSFVNWLCRLHLAIFRLHIGFCCLHDIIRHHNYVNMTWKLLFGTINMQTWRLY